MVFDMKRVDSTMTSAAKEPHVPRFATLRPLLALTQLSNIAIIKAKHRKATNTMTCLPIEAIELIAAFADRSTLNNMLRSTKAVKRQIDNSDIVQWPWPRTIPDTNYGEKTMLGMVLSPDGWRVGCWSLDDDYCWFEIFDRRHGRLSSLDRHFISMGTPLFSPDGRFFLIGFGEYCRVRICQLPEIGQLTPVIVSDHTMGDFSGPFSFLDSRTFIANWTPGFQDHGPHLVRIELCADGCIHLSAPKPLFPREDPRSGVGFALPAGNGNNVVAINYLDRNDGKVVFYDQATNTSTTRKLGCASRIEMLSFSPDGRTLIAVHSNREISWFDCDVASIEDIADEAKCIGKIPVHPRFPKGNHMQVLNITFSPNGTKLILQGKTNGLFSRYQFFYTIELPTGKVLSREFDNAAWSLLEN